MLKFFRDASHIISIALERVQVMQWPRIRWTHQVTWLQTHRRHHGSTLRTRALSSSRQYICIFMKWSHYPSQIYRSRIKKSMLADSALKSLMQIVLTKTFRYRFLITRIKTFSWNPKGWRKKIQKWGAFMTTRKLICNVSGLTRALSLQLRAISLGLQMNLQNLNWFKLS